MIMAPKPLLLKDFLALDSNSDSCNNGFSCLPRRVDPTMRGLIAAEGRLTRSRSRSKAALTKLSTIIKLFASSAEGKSTFLLPRSFSKKLTGSFRKKCDVVAVAEKPAPAASRSVRVRDIVRLRSFQEADVEDRRYLYFPSPGNAVVSRSSSSSSSEDGGSSGSDFLLSSCGSSDISGEHDAGAGEGESKHNSPPRSPKANSCLTPGVGGGEAAAGRRDHKEEEQEIDDQAIECHSEEEKDQLSPVSVMDFPYQDEDDDGNEDESEEVKATSPCFQQTLANIERTRHQLLQKIRRFESLAQLDMDPINLNPRFQEEESNDHVAYDEDDDTAADNTAWAILCQLEARVGQQESSIEKLLLGFFAEGLSSCSGNINNVNRSRLTRQMKTSAGELMEAASEWLISGGGCSEEVVGAWQVREMERSSGWTCFDGEAKEVAAEVEDGVMRWLVDELVHDLAYC